MEQNPQVYRRSASRIIAFAIFVAFASALLISPRGSLGAVRSIPQKRLQGQQRRRQPPPSAEKSASRYLAFTHKSHGKYSKNARARNLKCNNCHMIPSASEPDKITAAKHPNMIGYPYHDACLGCHREDAPRFFSGASPTICTVCHTRVSPRTTSREVYPEFPSPKHRTIMATEFSGYFPHGLHQRLLVLNRPPARDVEAGLNLLRVSFNAPDPEQTPPLAFDCVTCHFPDTRGPVALGIQSDETFRRVEADTFKTIPGKQEANAHASCFNCHWQSQEPTRDNCSGCHLSQSDYKAGKNPTTERKLEITLPSTLSLSAEKWFTDWPTGLPKRLSIKFRHDTHSLSADGKPENKHEQACTDCHIKMPQKTTLNIPKADVRIISCAQCHGNRREIPGGRKDVKVSISDEVDCKADPKCEQNPKPGDTYTCLACHTSVIGREQPPCSHYFVIGRPCPKAAQ